MAKLTLNKREKLAVSDDKTGVVKLEISIPSELFVKFEGDKENVCWELKKMGIFRLFQKGRISSGKAANALGITKREFLELLAKDGLPYYDWSQEQLEEEFQVAKNIYRRVKDEHHC